MHTRPRPNLDDVIGCAHSRLVVLDHDDGVADVAQLLQRANHPGVVAWVQPDARLIQHIQHAL